MMKHRSAALFAGVLAASSSTVVWSAPSRAQALVPSALTVLRASASPPAPAHSVALGPLPPSVELHVDVTLRLPDPSAVTAFITSVSDRRSANFHHFLRPGQFGQLFGPPPSEVTAVDAVLRSDGLHPGQVTSNRLSIPVTARVWALDRAFHVRLASYRMPDGRAAFTTQAPPSISAAVAPDIQGVIGLSDLDQPQSLLARSRVARSAPAASQEARQTTAGPTPCAPATNAASIDGSYTADRLASYYGMPPLYSLGDFGQGVNIAIVEFEPDLRTDIAAYQACFGTKATVNYIPVDGGAGSGDGGGEAALDIEDAIGLAPRATIDVYQAPGWDGSAGRDGDQYVYDLYSAIMNDDTDQVVSTSWGSCELDADSSLISSEQSLFSQAATQGQTVFAAAGDFGSTDCFSDSGSPNEFSLSVDDPASQPYVIGVGGTSIGTDSQTVWNDSTGAGGGGVSAVWCLPSYQDQPGVPGLIGPNSVPDRDDCTTGWAREVPDVSADADPETGYVTYWNGSWQAGEGGTSAGAPLWAAAAALVDSSPFCADYGSKDATGTLFRSLYSVAESNHYSDALYDVTSGNNVYPPSGYSGDLYPASTGYDMASGLGTPLLAYPGNYVPGLAAQICSATGTKLESTTITGVSPTEGPTSGSTPVTITGSGFLPIAGADRLEVGTKWVTVSCTTTARCTGTLPATKAGTDNLVMSVEGLTLSPLAVPDRFTFVAQPTITGITPASGPTKGGTKVTIRGSSFVGTLTVHFGTGPAKLSRVVSSSEIVVIAPPGSGTVYVTVSAAGGSSRTTAAGRFTFVAQPTITGITPASGPTKGGTKVTIRGSGFGGTLTVHFGTGPAKLSRVVSSSEIVVIAPPGSGTVYVTVSAAGGSSRATAAGRYRYQLASLMRRSGRGLAP
jgi:subtilase family serine protease